MRQNITPPVISYRPDVDGLRAVAVLAVVLCHLGLSFIPGGFVGVDIFFVISGFLITGIIQREMAEGTFTFGKFYARRARRILPALLTVVLATLPVAYFLFLPSELDKYALSALASIGFAANFHFKEDIDYFDGVATDQPLLHIWSLSVEEQFYFLWPLLLLGLWRWVNPKWRAPMASTLLVASLVYAQWRLNTKFEEAFYLLPSRWWELMLGALIAMVGYRLNPGRRLGIALSSIGGAMIVASILFLNEGMLFPGLWAVPVCLGTGLMIWTGLHHKGLLHRLLATAPMVGIGKVSYSLYLWHWPLVVFVTYYLGDELSYGIMVAIFSASLLLSILSWRYIEQPIRHAGRSVLPTGRSLKLAGVGILGSALLFLSAHVTGGYAWRVPAELLTIEQQAEETSPWEKGCHGKVTKSVDEQLALCSFGVAAKGAPYRVMVWGDSHANHYVPSFNLLAESKGWRGVQITGPACPPVLGITRHLLGGIDCKTMNRNVMDTLTAYPSIKMVVLSARWSAYAVPFYQNDRHGKKMTITDDRNEVTNPEEVLAARLADTIKLLQQRGIKVIVMGQVPSYEYSPNVCLLHKAWAGQPLAGCGQPVDKARQALENGNQVLRRVVAGNREITWFNPLDVLCDNQVCQASVGKTLLYNDDDHMNRHGAEALYHLWDIGGKLAHFRP